MVGSGMLGVAKFIAMTPPGEVSGGAGEGRHSRCPTMSHKPFGP